MRSLLQRCALALAFATCICSARRVQTFAERFDEPRGNATGLRKLQPFERGFPKALLEKLTEINRVLATGQVWNSAQLTDKRTAIGRAVMDIQASPSVVWKQLYDFSTVTSKFSTIVVCDVYKRFEERGKNIERVFVKYVSKVLPLVKLTYHLVYSFDLGKQSVTWSLDTEKKNDFDDIQGHWHVESQPEDSSHARAFFEVGLILPGWLPQNLKDKLAEKSVDEITWLQRESEKEAGASEPGKLRPFLAGRPTIVLDEAAERQLAEGKVWQTSNLIKNGVTGHAVMDVEVPVVIIWSQLAGFASYPKKMSLVQNCEVYKREVRKKYVFFGKVFERIFVKFVLKVAKRQLIYHVVYTYEPALQSLTWTLDAEKENDLEIFQGHWYVEAHEEIWSSSRVFLEIALVMPDSVPKRVINELTKDVLGDSSSWLNRASKHAARRVPHTLLPNWIASNSTI